MTRIGTTASSLGLAMALLAGASGLSAQTLRPPPSTAPSGTPVVVGTERPSVFVDQSVLDSLGPSPTLPQLLRGPNPNQKVTLHPPARPQAPSAPRAASVTQPTAPAKPSAARSAPEAATPAPAKSASAQPAPAAPAPSPAPAPPPVAAAPAQPASPPPAAAQPAQPAQPSVAAQPMPAPQAPPPPPAVASAPPPSPAQPAQPRPAPSQQASAAPSAATPAGNQPPAIAFAAGSFDLPAGADRALKQLADRMKGDEALRLQLLAFASGTPETASQARRLSLSRALAVRSYLIEQGVRSTRIDVRALGSRSSEGGSPDRVDLVVSGS